MSLKDNLHSKIAADREAGREIPPVIEELFLMLVDFLEPGELQSTPAPQEPEKVGTENPITEPVDQKPEEPAIQQ